MRTFRPQLPRTELLAPYLERIDKSRYYSNTGPLVMEYEQRMEEHFNCGVVSVSSCTAGLTACLLAQELPVGGQVAMPSWTFVATAAAVCGAGMVPYFCDVYEDDFLIKINPNNSLKSIIVSPFGYPVSAFSKYFIIDAAAAFDSVKPSICLTVISTHATKCFGTGEGGLVLSTDMNMLKRVRAVTNFGLSVMISDLDRQSEYIGLNAKMSEYHAAVGLAELDGWSQKRERWLEAKSHYEALFKDFRSPVSGEWACPQYPIVLEKPALPIMEKLAEKGINTRKVWGDGVHRLNAYNHFPRTELPVTEKLAERTLFLPFGVDMTKEEAKEVYDAVTECL